MSILLNIFEYKHRICKTLLNKILLTDKNSPRYLSNRISRENENEKYAVTTDRYL